MTHTPYLERPINGGAQKLYRFDNGYGASVVRHAFSYGGAQGLWEVAVIRFDGDGALDWGLTYDTPITDDVLGRLTDAQVTSTLDDIAALP